MSGIFQASYDGDLNRVKYLIETENININIQERGVIKYIVFCCLIN